jgi:8-oxo-dGTP pyrophosphatase MutT (NUDIX family)
MERRLSSVAVILENPVGQALIVKANYKSYWSFPGGVIDKDETPKQAGVREVAEEVGIHLDESKLQFVAVVDRKSADAHTYQFVFRAPLESTMVDHIVLQSSELEEFALVTAEDVKSGNRTYGKVISHWVNGASGYIEQEFNRQQNG